MQWHQTNHQHATAGTPGFMFLIKQPTHKLWIELKEDQATTFLAM